MMQPRGQDAALDVDRDERMQLRCAHLQAPSTNCDEPENTQVVPGFGEVLELVNAGGKVEPMHFDDRPLQKARRIGTFPLPLRNVVVREALQRLPYPVASPQQDCP